jgi:hypothetical protein
VSLNLVNIRINIGFKLDLHPLEGGNISDLGGSSSLGTAQLRNSQVHNLRAVVAVGPEINTRVWVATGRRRGRSDRASSSSRASTRGGGLGGSGGAGSSSSRRRLSSAGLALGVEVVELDTLVSAGAARSAAPVLATTLSPISL